MTKAISFLILVFMALSSCKKEVGVPGPVGSRGNQGLPGVDHDTASISGNLSLFSYLSWPVADSSAVTVELSSGSLQRSVLTDASGHYVFYGLEKGTYDLTYQKAGFGTMKVFGISHSPGGPLSTVVPDVYLLQQPVGTAVQGITGIDGYPIEIHINLDTSSYEYTPYSGNLVLLIGKDPVVDMSHYLIMQTENISTDGLGGYVCFIDRSSLTGLFNAGDTIYVTACTYNRYVHKLKDPNTFFDTGSSAYYVDPASGNYVYPNLSSAPTVLSFPY
ncbi:MAG: carboxypeptidase-like regulatory domain-containing protein [Bacteroidota bacterium]|nr:carboxypeptidase-like regulatory domain-containing protein [Bacteroidota bacterium]MDP4214203.1 carboxypeptidase-like regulatory domain-containing protein [Bacteroidota bacterium]MDP4252027.1 carboxypeptidase-like regulatory domain-containing protein [Bacteroidota bacterium]